MPCRSFILVALLAASSACSRATVCDNGVICASGLACDTAHGTCVLPEQLESCQGRPDQAPCEIGGAPALCHLGVCVVDRCGDGLVGPTEACDDGNRDPDDACNADCTSDYSCGNGLVDVDEQCDCGADPERRPVGCADQNSDEAGAMCKLDCTLHCGDGVLNAAEACDTDVAGDSCVTYGFDYGGLACSSACGLDFDRCGREGWRKIQRNFLAGYGAAWARSPNDLYLVGDAVFGGGQTSVVHHFDGLNWTVTDLGAGELLNDVWGDALQTITVGNEGLIYRTTGDAWTAETSPTEENLRRLAGSTTQGVFAISSNLLIERGPSGWVEATGAPSGPFTDIWVGDEITYLIVSTTGAIHKRVGDTLTTETPVGGIALHSVWGNNDSDLIAVGNTLGGDPTGVVLENRGAGWTQVTLPAPVKPLRSVGGDGDHAIAIANDGTTIVRSGGTWMIVDSVFPSGPDGGVSMVDGVAYAACTGGLAEAKTFWTRKTPDLETWRKVWAGDDYVVHVGDETALRIDHAGTVETTCASFPACTNASLVAVWGRSSDDIYALSAGDVYHFDGGALTDADAPAGEVLTSVGGDDDSVFVGTESGKIHRLEDGEWSTLDGPIANEPISLLLGTPSALYALSGSKLHRLDGTTWTEITEAGTLILSAGSLGDSLVTVAPAISHHFEGTAWSLEGLLAFFPSLVTLGAANDVFAAEGQRLLWYDGGLWSPISTPSDASLVASVAAGSLDVHIVDDAGDRRILVRLGAWPVP